MADYPVSIEKVRNVLVELRNSVAGPHIRTGVDMAIAKLEGFTPMDAVPVVRCRECQDSEQCPAVSDDYLYCNTWDTVVSEDGYCYQGERKEGDHAAD